MSDKPKTGVPFDGDDAVERRLWDALEDLPREGPSPRLRQSFYHELHRAGSPSWTERTRALLGFSGNAGWVTAMTSLLLGLVLGLALDPTFDSGLQGPEGANNDGIAALEQQVAMLNRSLILDRLENESASKRLRGIIDAGGMVAQDPEVARALPTRAIEDRVYSVRSAAIDALGPRLTTPAVGGELMALLEAAESPLVQLALVDLVLRHGSVAQLERLLQLAEEGRLHPDLVQHVNASVRRERV